MKALCLALYVALAATGARASDPIYDAPDKAPDVYGPLVWRDVHGFWFRDEQVQRIDLRIKYLEDRATKECTDATQAANRQWLGGSPSSWISVGLALVVGVAGGFYVAKHF